MNTQQKKQKQRIVYLASLNSHKLEELVAIIGHIGCELRLCSELSPNINWDETGTTYFENALIKANKVRQYTRECVIADDSGLEVEMLEGQPGIFSSRFAGVGASSCENNAKILDLMKSKPKPWRARFFCCIVFINEKGEVSNFSGECKGEIIGKRKGDSGFGYDPLFYIPELGKTMAEISDVKKHEISHRGKALREFEEKWRAGKI